MSRTVIHVEGLGKRYRIDQGAQHTALRNLLGDALRAPVRLLRGSNHDSRAQPNGSASDGPGSGINHRGSSFIWALKDVSFEVKEGEVVGLIGRNGSGKSTLLKILARITRPTEGEAEIRGRVGSLLEVGTGFHPELTGRENVYMSGAVLGMRAAEIRQKFDEIVAFSEVERFLDTPLKYYSSGMQMRLAFAVAAHLEPEILLVDEVLAVGDASFQRKCLGKMDDISKQGRTIVFVSHNVNAIESLCGSVILLADGKIVRYSKDVREVVRLYLAPAVCADTVDLSYHPNRMNQEKVFEEIAITDGDGAPSHCLLPGASVTFHLKVRPPAEVKGPWIGIGVTSSSGLRVFAVGTHIGGNTISSVNGKSTIRVRFQMPPLFPGQYSLDLVFCDGARKPLDTIYSAAAFEVLKGESISMLDSYSPHMGQIMVPSEWGCVREADEVPSPVEIRDDERARYG